MAKGDRTGNRKTREQRRTIKVPELGYYLIVTDTEGTERCFFAGLHQSLSEEVRNKLVIKVVETKTRSMIDKCLELTVYEAQYRIPWIVFDRDQVIGFDEIISEAEKKGIQVGWSNPCFEIWMYAYFGAMPAIQDSWTCCSEFGRVYESKTGQKYSKADEKMYGKISNAGNEEKAIQIAQQKLEQCEREGKGADSCPNAVTVDEEELIQALQEYFQEILSKKKKVINYVIKEFQRVYKAKDENIEYEKQLNAELNKLHKSREKYMDMYTDDLISREELNEKIGGMRKEIERLENELKMVSYHLTKGEQLEAILNSTFKQLEDITDVHEMTNAQLKRLINKIEVDKDGNVDIYLHLIGDLGLDETVLIEGDKNTEEKGTKKVPNSYNHT